MDIYFIGAHIICSDPNCSNLGDIDNSNVYPIRDASKKIKNNNNNDQYVKVDISAVNRNLTIISQRFNPLTAKLFNLNFHPLEVVSR